MTFMWVLKFVATQGFGIRLTVEPDGWVTATLTQHSVPVSGAIIEGRAQMRGDGEWNFIGAADAATRMMFKQAKNAGAL